MQCLVSHSGRNTFFTSTPMLETGLSPQLRETTRQTDSVKRAASQACSISPSVASGKKHTLEKEAKKLRMEWW